MMNEFLNKEMVISQHKFDLELRNCKSLAHLNLFKSRQFRCLTNNK